MKVNVTILFLILSCIMLWSGCSKQTVDPEFTGGIEGTVQNSSTGEPIASASISTTPGTDAILTDENGQFIISDIPTGNYNILIDKDDFISKSVRIIVREDEITTAQILLKSDDDAPGNANIDAQVTNFFNTNSSDSMFVEVDFMVKNTSANTNLGRYEVYFQIYTPQTTFSQDFEGDSLFAGEMDYGSFTQYIRQFSADSVVVIGTFAPDPS